MCTHERSLRILESFAEDIPLIRKLAEDTWWPAYNTILPEEQIRYMLEKLYAAEVLQGQMESGHQFLLVYEHELALAFASWSAAAEHGTGKLHKIYVLPEAQGKGVGRFLLDNIEARARDQGCRILELNVNRFNKARSFYEKQGFAIVRSVDIPVGPYFMNDYIMRKRILQLQR